MSQEFDPYRIWLGIPAEEQPANHYRLLGIELFEADPDVISNAADRQMTHVRTFQSGKYSSQSQKVLNELSTARVTLLDKKRKTDYDAQLKQKLDSQKPVVTTAVPIAPVPPVAPLATSLPVAQPPLPGAPVGSVPPVPPGVVPPAGPFGGVPGSLPGFTSTNNGIASPSIPGNHEVPPPIGGLGTFKVPPVNPVGPHINTSATSRKSSKNKKESTNNNAAIGVAAGIGVLILILGFLMVSGKKDNIGTADNSPPSDSSDINAEPLDWNQRFMPKVDQENHDKKEDNKSAKNDPSGSEEKKTVREGLITQEEIEASQTEDANQLSGNPSSLQSGNGASEEIDALLSKTGLAKKYPGLSIPEILSADNSRLIQNILINPATNQFIVGQKNNTINVYNLGEEKLQLSLQPGTAGILGGFVVLPSEKYYAFYNPSSSERDAFKQQIALPTYEEDPDREDIRPAATILTWGSAEIASEQPGEPAGFLKGYLINSISATVDKDNNELIAVAATDGLVHIYNPASKSDYLKFSASDEPVPAPEYPAGTSEKLKESKKTFLKVVTPKSVPTCIQYSSNGKFLAGGNSDGLVYIWNPDLFEQTSGSVESSVMLKIVARKQLSNAPILGVSFSDSNQKLFAYSEDGVVAQWSWLSSMDRPICSVAVQEKLRYAALAGNDKYLITQTAKGLVQIWTWGSGTAKVLVEMTLPMTFLAAHPEKPLFLAVDKSGTLAWYNIPESLDKVAQTQDFSNVFVKPVYESVPQADLWQAKAPDAKAQIDKKLSTGTDAQKAAELQSMLKKIGNDKKLDPVLRYAVYREILLSAARIHSLRMIQTSVAETIKYFDDDPNALLCSAYVEMLSSGLKGQELLDAMDKALSVGEKASLEGNQAIVDQITKAIGAKSVQADESIRKRLKDLKAGNVKPDSVTNLDLDSSAGSLETDSSTQSASGNLDESLYSIALLNSRERDCKGKLQQGFGDSNAMRTSLDKSLKWIADRQAPEGFWSFAYSVNKGKNKETLDLGTADRKYAATAMAVLTYLGAGENPQKSEYSRNIKAGINFLVSYDPSVPEAGTNFAVRPLVLQALLEAQDVKFNRSVLARLLDVTLQTVNTDGGWGVENKKTSDVWATFWNAQALYIAQKLDHKMFKPEHKQALTRSREYFAGCFDSKTNQPEAILLAAAGIVLSEGKLTQDQEEAVDDALQSSKIINDDYMTRYAKVRAMALLGLNSKWSAFIRESVPEMIAEQKATDPEMGSWIAKNPSTGYNKHFTEGGRFASTIFNALILENSYRYAPIKTK